MTAPTQTGSDVRGPSPAATAVPELDLDGALALGLRLAAPAAALAFTSGDLDAGIDLPDPFGAPEDRARLLAVAPLYLVAELEATGLLRGAEALAGLFVSGGLPGDVGAAGDDLHRLWVDRNRRFTADERSAIFARVFGSTAGPRLAIRGATNTAFEGLMIDLADAVYSGVPPAGGRPSPAAEVVLAAAGLALVTNLANRHDGIPDVAAAELVAAAQVALEVFKRPEVQRTLGARSVWTAVREVARRYLDVDPPVALHVTRGAAGLALLSWLADAIAELDGYDAGAPVVPPAVAAAASRWMTATLSLHEAAEGARLSRDRRP